MRLVALFVSLWLPLQGYVAPLMPYCQHADSQSGRSDEAMPCHGGHADEAGEAQQEATQICPDCDACGLCHLAGSAAPVSLALPWSHRNEGADLPLYSRPYRSHIPEQPGRPPLA